MRRQLVAFLRGGVFCKPGFGVLCGVENLLFR